MGNITEYEKYVVTSPISMTEGTIPTGADITVVHGCVYLNGGLLTPGYQDSLTRVINEEKQRGFRHLRPERAIYNKL